MVKYYTKGQQSSWCSCSLGFWLPKRGCVESIIVEGWSSFSTSLFCEIIFVAKSWQSHLALTEHRTQHLVTQRLALIPPHAAQQYETHIYSQKFLGALVPHSECFFFCAAWTSPIHSILVTKLRPANELNLNNAHRLATATTTKISASFPKGAPFCRAFASDI